MKIVCAVTSVVSLFLIVKAAPVRERVSKLLGAPSVKIDNDSVYAQSTVSCTSQLCSLLDFTFDFLFASTDLIDAFRDVEPFKRYLDDLPCLNNYAFESGWIATEVNTEFKYQLINQTGEECNQKIHDLITDSKEALKKRIGREKMDNATYDAIILTAEKFFFKYVILILAHISDEQKKLTKKNFVNDIMDAFN